jgi:hypothetical protein
MDTPHDLNGSAELADLIAAFMAAAPAQRIAAMAVLLRDRDDGGEPADNGKERFLNQQQLAETLGVHTTTIRRWGIPCHRLGRVPRYLMAEVREYLDSKTFKRRLAELKKQRT